MSTALSAMLRWISSAAMTCVSRSPSSSPSTWIRGGVSFNIASSAARSAGMSYPSTSFLITGIFMSRQFCQKVLYVFHFGSRGSFDEFSVSVHREKRQIIYAGFFPNGFVLLRIHFVKRHPAVPFVLGKPSVLRRDQFARSAPVGIEFNDCFVIGGKRRFNLAVGYFLYRHFRLC